jgi:hypothetical protein
VAAKLARSARKADRQVRKLKAAERRLTARIDSLVV